MPANERPVAEVAAAILEGTPIDWPAAETRASAEDLGLLEELRLLCTVADFHRHLPGPGGDPSPARDDGESAQYWGRLRLIERVGGGTFGDVYRAWDPRLHREVALKLIPTPQRPGTSRSAAIIREGRLLARVRHPGVVTIYDAEQIGAQVGLCMEFVEGPTLEQRLDQNGIFTADEAVEIVLQVCDALSAAHNAGVLHRDVKAANVVVKPDGRIVLMDFGAGRQLDDAAADLTGTPLYLAPEVLQGLDATVRSDVYSVGVLLHHMVTASYPVQASSLSELRLTHARLAAGERSRERAPMSGVPARLAAVIERATDPRPERRPENAAALAADLRALQRGGRTYGWAVAASVAALIAVAMAAGLILARSGPGRAGAGADGAPAASRAPVGMANRNLEAYTLYVQGRTALDRFTPDGTLRARGLFEQALKLDPNYPEVHAALVQVYLQVNPAIPDLSGEEALRRATEAAARALSLDDSLPDAHLAGALVKSARADWEGAERGYRRAIELGPSHVVTRQEYARWLSLLGRFDEALNQARVAESLDPQSPRAIMAVATVFRLSRRYEEAIPQARKALDVDPGHLTAHSVIGHSYLGLGRYDQAIEALRMGRAGGNLGNAYAKAGRASEARAVLAQLQQRYDKTGLGAGEIAQTYSGLGDVDRAFEWLDRVDRVHAGWPTTYKVAPVWDPLRSDPRFTALLKKYGLSD